MEPAVEKVSRLNQIGSKFQLLDWLTTTIQAKTGYTDLKGKAIADLFAGTGIVSQHFRKLGAQVISNDAELQSSIITHAFTTSLQTPKCQELLTQLQADLDAKHHMTTAGQITQHQSPHNGCERMFFTVDNAQRIDQVRRQLEKIQPTITEDESKFLLASLLLAADAVSNVPAVQGCYLKKFKAKALHPLTLKPIHTNKKLPTAGSRTTNEDVLRPTFLNSFTANIVYLDPPQNERQQSKNYFPLNLIAKTPADLEKEPPLKGKTGIPTDCFLSPFCRKGERVELAFHTLFRDLKAEWIFLSYNSESLVTKEKMIQLMQKQGEVSVTERDQKRFKSFEYNDDKEIKEQLFCLHKAPVIG